MSIIISAAIYAAIGALIGVWAFQDDYKDLTIFDSVNIILFWPIVIIVALKSDNDDT